MNRSFFRLQETTETLIERVSTLEAQISANTELNGATVEPAIIRFIEDAYEASANTTSEAKRRLLGDAIAKRLSCATDSVTDVSLRSGLRIMDEATEAQLVLIGAVWIKDLAVDVAAKDEAEMERALANRYGRIILHEAARQYTVSDLDHLEALGACRQGSRHSGAFWGDSRSYAARWLEKRGLRTADRPSYSVAEFPTLSAWSERLQPGTQDEYASGRPPSIEDVSLTPAGIEIGEIVVRRLAEAA